MIRKSYPVADGHLSALHLGDITKPPELVFLHATGFNALAYRRLLEPLGCHVIAIDMRGHGMSELPADPATLKNWHIIRDDIGAFLTRYIETPIVLAGHSCGAVVSFLTAAQFSENVRGLVSFDPVCIPMIARLGASTTRGRETMKRRLSLARNAGKRRDVFPSLDAAFDRYKGRGTFKNLSDEILKDYLEGGMRPHPDGMQLTCAPLWEQAVFVAQGHNIFKAAKKAPSYRKVIFAKKFGPHSASTREKMRGIIGGSNVKYLKNRAHFFPLEDIDFARQYLADAIAQA